MRKLWSVLGFILILSAYIPQRVNAQAPALETAQDFFNAGIFMYQHEELDDAIELITEAIRRDPNLALAYSFRGAIYRQKGNLDLAIADYIQALRIVPNNADFVQRAADVYEQRGIAHFQARNFDRAISDLTEAIRLNPRGELYFVRGLAYHEKGNLLQAIEDMETVLRLDPNAPPLVRQNLEIFRQQLGR